MRILTTDLNDKQIIAIAMHRPFEPARLTGQLVLRRFHFPTNPPRLSDRLRAHGQGAASQHRDVHGAAAVSFGLINSIGQLGGFTGNYAIGFLNDRTHSLTASFAS
jgi:hypothetical protein